MIGYKATDMNGCCRGFKKEISGIDAEAEMAELYSNKYGFGSDFNNITSYC